MFDSFREVVTVDFEFTATTGERPVPVCLVAQRAGAVGAASTSFRINLGQHRPTQQARMFLFVAFYVSAELGCYRAPWAGRCPRAFLIFFTEFSGAH